MTEHTGNTSLFAIFALSIYSLFLFCYTIYQCCSATDTDADPGWTKSKKPKSGIRRLFERTFSKGNIGNLILWAFWFLLFYYVSQASKDLKPFDPYDILGVDKNSTIPEIKKAYRELSRRYHPDKNPDPEAQKYFTEYITKANEALTDDASRDNWQKYGHPDGPQPMTMAVALPEWLFSKDRKMAPVMLLVLVGCGILLPLSVISWYMLSSDQYEGPNRIMRGTYYNYLVDPKICIKESMSILRIPDTLVTAAEFIQLPTFAAQEPLVDDVWKAIMHAFPDYKDKKNAFWKRKGSVLKAHLLLLAYLERQEDKIPQPLKQDLTFVLQKTPLLLEEIFKISCSPRPPYGYGWMAPSVASIEMLQSLIQAVPVRERKPQGRVQDNTSSLLQLPHFDQGVVKTLRNKNKIRTLQDLQDLPAEERRRVLEAAGLSSEEAEEVDGFIAALPSVSLRVECVVDGEDTIYEQDAVKCQVKVLLTRPSHKGMQQLSGRKSSKAVTSTYPLAYDESWYVMVVDAGGNWVMAARDKVSLMEAEAAGLELGKKSSTLVVPGSKGGKGAAAEEGRQAPEEADWESAQVVELMFPAPKNGKYDLTVLCMSDCYVGCDASAKVQLKVLPQSRAMTEGRATRQVTAAPAAASTEAADESEKEEADSDADEDEDEDDEDEEYDSEESGEEETDDES